MPGTATLLGAVTVAALLGPVSTALAEEPIALTGAYTVVDHRIASDVAATVASYDPDARAREMGQTINFGETLTWYDGRFCDGWSAVAGPAPDPIAADPNLADLQSNTATNTPIAIACDDAPFAEVVQLDADRLIGFVPNGTMYVILQRTDAD